MYASLNWSDSLQQSYGSAWRHIVCEDDCPENSPDRKRVISGKGKEQVSWLRPHERCFTAYDTPEPTEPVEFWDHGTMRLTVLRTCRQIYVEANSILWATNTFSFNDAIAFKRFMMTRTIHHKRLIRNVRLDMGWWEDNSTPWNSSLSKALVKSLSSLRSLRFYITHEMTRKDYELVRKVGFVGNTNLCRGLRNLSTLPLTNVEVVVRSPRYQCSQGVFWTEDDRAEVAEALKKMLLAPKGAEDSSETQEQKNE